ncbi:MAG: hypothetical protein AAGG81_07460 [Chlamydiota bacterium]
MFSIENTRALDRLDEDTFYQRTLYNEANNIISRPLETPLDDNRKVLSFKGRFVCLLNIATPILDGLRSLAVKMTNLPMMILGSMDALFCGDFLISLKTFAGSFFIVGGIILQPVAVLSDTVKLVAGAIIHPALAIGLKSEANAN